MKFIMSKFKSISMPQELSELHGDNTKLIDVRTAEEYRNGHIPGSLNIPLDRADSIYSLIPSRSTALFVYCLSGARSITACKIFASLGYENVFNIGGITEWNGTIEKGEKAI